MTTPHPIASIVGVLVVALSLSAFLIWVERRLLALWQDRYGPNRVGPFGLLQVVADMIKIFTKEDWVPPFADKPVFVIAPAIIMVTVLMSFAVLPIAPGIVVCDLNIGLLFFLGMSSLGVYSIVLAGWASGNKYSLLGGLRAAAQMISYEVFMGLSLMGVVLLAGTFDLTAIVEAQRGLWYVIPQFLGFVLFLIAGVAEARRLPFDLPEAEAELVAGFHSEYSGMKFGMFFVGEYLGITLISSMIAVLFLGRMERPMAASPRVVPDQGLCFSLLFHLVARFASEDALRPVDVSRMEGDVSAGARESACHRRNRPGDKGKEGKGVDAMLSVIRTIWNVFLHSFRRRVTIQYPDEKPYLTPRTRGRIILSRDPDGGERCVACYLCAVACPVDCIALQATEDEHGRRYPEFFRINFSRCIFCGLCEDACPTYAIQLTPDFEMSRVQPAELGLREGRSVDQWTWQIPRIQLLACFGSSDRRQRQG